MTHSTRSAPSTNDGAPLRSPVSGHVVDAKPRIHRPDAIAILRAFIDLIEPCCLELRVAGSLRRQLAYVSDGEVVAVSRKEPVTIDLLQEQIVVRDLLDERMAYLLEAGVVAKRLDRRGSPRWGPTLKYLTFEGMNIDLFCPEAERMVTVLATNWRAHRDPGGAWHFEAVGAVMRTEG